jgi:hypothetical protein
MSLPDGESLKNQILGSMKDGAKTRNLAWELTDDYALELVFKNCEYCGRPPSNKIRGRMQYNGIDRVDSKRGYVAGNVVSCCKTCNLAKRTMSLGDFMEWVEQVYKHSISGDRDAVQQK